jgi:SAM-dependent methyltransferase
MTTPSMQTVENFFYDKRDALTRDAACKILEIVKKQFGTFDSVVDVGCGVGTWLSVAEKNFGVKKIKGIEAEWIKDIEVFATDKNLIQVQNLESEWDLSDSYDLGICLEVAEHLSEEAGFKLVKNLSGHCRVILFSAAIPNQGGNGHINEQWPSYWQAKFAQCGMEAVDSMRPIIWADDSIPWWYRQNILIYANPQNVDSFYNKMSSDVDLRSNQIAPLVIQKEPTVISKAKELSLKEIIKMLFEKSTRRLVKLISSKY